GRELEEARRKAGEPLPPPSDNVPLVCVIERLTGTDAYGERCREVATEVLTPLGLIREEDSVFNTRNVEFGLKMSIHFAYPNDDLFYLVASGDPLRQCGFFASD